MGRILNSIGLELMASTTGKAEVQAMLCYGGQLIHHCAPAKGRLLRPRHLAREAAALLRHHVDHARREAEAMSARSVFGARQHLADAQLWAKRAGREHLAPHRIRLTRTERLHCWQLPGCFLRALQAQLKASLEEVPTHERLRACFVVPATQRVLGPLSIYLGTGTGKREPMHWECCWHERVSVVMGPGDALVMLE